MNASEFASRWGALVKEEQARAEAAGVSGAADGMQLVAAVTAMTDTPSFPPDAARFLVEAGLPKSCAPFLSFAAVVQGPLPLTQYYGAHQFRPSDLSRLAPFYVLGFDGAGNPLCLDSARDGEIVMLDHEDGFQTRTFVASRVATLAEALLIVHSVPHRDFVEHLRPFDPRAAEESAFLPAEVRMLID